MLCRRHASARSSASSAVRRSRHGRRPAVVASTLCSSEWDSPTPRWAGGPVGSPGDPGRAARAASSGSRTARCHPAQARSRTTFHACYSPAMTTPPIATNGRRIKKTAIATPAELNAAWAPDVRRSDTWTPRPWVTAASMQRSGEPPDRQHRAAVRARWSSPPVATRSPSPGPGSGPPPRPSPAPPRPDGPSAFAFYRGAPAVMALDLSTTPGAISSSRPAATPTLELRPVRSPERTLVFDANDFDETLPGRGNGTSSAWRRASHRRPGERVHGGRAARSVDGDGGPTASDGALCRDASARHLVRPDDRRRHPRPLRGGGRLDERGSIQGRQGARRHLRQGARQGPDEGHRP